VCASGETDNLICSGRAITAQTILCEIGTEVSCFRNASAFASWLGICPENKINGSNVLYTKSRRVRSRVATPLRMAANSLHHAKDYLGEFIRRITGKLGKPQAITDTAYKLRCEQCWKSWAKLGQRIGLK
jgi:transposase